MNNTVQLTYQEAVRVLGCTENAVKQAVRKATLTGGKGIVVADALFEMRVAKAGRVAEWQVFLAERLAVDSHGSANKNIENDTHNRAYLLDYAIGEYYVKFVPHYNKVYGGKKDSESVLQAARSAALIELCGSAAKTKLAALGRGIEPPTQTAICEALAAHETFTLWGLGAKNVANIRKWFINHPDPLGLVHGNSGKANAAVHAKNPDILGWAVSLLANPRNYTAANAHRYLRTRCQMFGYATPSERWLQKLRLDKEAILAAERWDDNNRHKNAYRYYTPTAKAAFAGTRWTIDGTQHNSIMHKAGDKGKHLYWISVRDEFSGDILAVVPCYTEGFANHIAVVKQAIYVTGYLPYELRHDKFPGHNTEQWQAFAEQLEMCGVRLTVTASAWGKARHERGYATMQSVFDQLVAGGLTYGDGVMATRKTSRARMKVYNNVQRKATQAGWDFEKAKNLLLDTVETYRTTPYSAWSKKYKHLHRSPQQLHDGCEKPEAYQLTESEWARLCWPRIKITPSGGYIHFVHRGEDYYYRVSPQTFYDRRRARVSVAHHPDHPEKVYLFEEQTEVFLEECLRQAIVATDGADPDWGALQDNKAWKKASEDYRKSRFEEMVNGAAAEYVDTETGELITLEDTPATLACRTTIDEMGALLGGIAPKERVAASESALLIGQNEEVLWQKTVSRTAPTEGVNAPKRPKTPRKTPSEAPKTGNSNAILQPSAAQIAAERAYYLNKYGNASNNEDEF